MEAQHPVDEPDIAGVSSGAIAGHYSQLAGMFNGLSRSPIQYMTRDHRM
jgi:hypothetical protein